MQHGSSDLAEIRSSDGPRTKDRVQAVARRAYRSHMGTPDEDFRELLPTLLLLYPSLPSIRFKPGFQRVAHVAHGWYMRCHRGVEAVLLLEDDGFEIEAAPIRRSVLEHVVALKWLADEGAVVAEILRRGAAHDAAKRKDSIERANWTSVDVDLFDAVINDAAGIDKSNDFLLHFKERCDRAGTPQDWVVYLVETAQSHPCWESALPYLDSTTGTLYALAQPVGRQDQAGFCAVHLYEALDAVNHISRGRPLSKRLNTLERQIRSIAARQRREKNLTVPDGFDPGEQPRGRPRVGS
jgi:hypothetical protein